MFEMSSKSVGTTCIRNRARMLRFSFLLSFSAVSASSSPSLEITKTQALPVLPRNYCLGNVASLGTGLVRASVPSGTKTSLQVVRFWTGWIRASASGKYGFSLPDNGGRIIINRQQIFPSAVMSSKPDAAEIELSTNRFYAITVETPNSEESTLPLKWRRPDGRRETVPKAYLYPPLATAESY